MSYSHQVLYYDSTKLELGPLRAASPLFIVEIIILFVLILNRQSTTILIGKTLLVHVAQVIFLQDIRVFIQPKRHKNI